MIEWSKRHKVALGAAGLALAALTAVLAGAPELAGTLWTLASELITETTP